MLVAAMKPQTAVSLNEAFTDTLSTSKQPMHIRHNHNGKLHCDLDALRLAGDDEPTHRDAPLHQRA